MRVLVICTGNTCRSQMAEGFLRNKFPLWEIYSAGTEPGERVNPFAIEVMKEKGIDISSQKPESLDLYLKPDLNFDYVITVCDDANEKCPNFPGKVKYRLHYGFRDPASAIGTTEEILEIYRNVRDEIFATFSKIFD